MQNVCTRKNDGSDLEGRGLAFEPRILCCMHMTHCAPLLDSFQGNRTRQISDAGVRVCHVTAWNRLSSSVPSSCISKSRSSAESMR